MADESNVQTEQTDGTAVPRAEPVTAPAMPKRVRNTVRDGMPGVAKGETTPEDKNLVRMEKDDEDEDLDVHPTTVQAHIERGWRVKHHKD